MRVLGMALRKLRKQTGHSSIVACYQAWWCGKKHYYQQCMRSRHTSCRAELQLGMASCIHECFGMASILQVNIQSLAHVLCIIVRHISC